MNQFFNMRMRKNYLNLLLAVTFIYVLLCAIRCLLHEYAVFVWICLGVLLLYDVFILWTLSVRLRRISTMRCRCIKVAGKRILYLSMAMGLLLFWGHELLEVRAQRDMTTVTITEDELAAIAEAQKYGFLTEDNSLKSGLEATNYASATEEEQLTVLARVLGYECEYLGIEMPAISAVSLNANLGGYYDADTNAIVLNRDYLGRRKLVLTTLLHEAFHAYQYACIQQLDVSKMQQDNTQHTLLCMRNVVTWKREYEEKSVHAVDLDSDEGLIDYYTQSSEQSAREYALDRLELYLDSK